MKKEIIFIITFGVFFCVQVVLANNCACQLKGLSIPVSVFDEQDVFKLGQSLLNGGGGVDLNGDGNFNYSDIVSSRMCLRGFWNWDGVQDFSDCSDEPAVIEDYAVYEDALNNFTFKYPTSWDISEVDIEGETILKLVSADGFLEGNFEIIVLSRDGSDTAERAYLRGLSPELATDYGEISTSSGLDMYFMKYGLGVDDNLIDKYFIFSNQEGLVLTSIFKFKAEKEPEIDFMMDNFEFVEQIDPIEAILPNSFCQGSRDQLNICQDYSCYAMDPFFGTVTISTHIQPRPGEVCRLTQIYPDGEGELVENCDLDNDFRLRMVDYYDRLSSAKESVRAYSEDGEDILEVDGERVENTPVIIRDLGLCGFE